MIEKIKKYNWKPWLSRDFKPFVLSVFLSATKIGKTGTNISLSSIVYQNKEWFICDDVLESEQKEVEEYFKNHKVKYIINSLELFYEESLEIIDELKNKEVTLEVVKAVGDILITTCNFIMITHSIEFYLDKLLAKTNFDDEFISKASMPRRKNKIVLMQQDILNNVSDEIILEKYSFFTAREVYDEPLSQKDLNEIKKDIKYHGEVEKAEIPEEYKELFENIQDLVYLRTERTDIFYELLFKLRPVLKKIEKYFNLDDISYYPIDSLIENNPRKIENFVSCIAHNGKYEFLNEEVVKVKQNLDVDEVKGNIAYKGKVKVVMGVKDLSKVQNGDILVTQMTFPAFISAMEKAAAFVTNEGGITCHAAIVSREMKKPCVIATKIATKVFKDNDVVEVDAENGIVKKV